MAHLSHLPFRGRGDGGAVFVDWRGAVARALVAAARRMDGYIQAIDGLFAVGDCRLSVLDNRPAVFHPHADAGGGDLVCLLVDRANAADCVG